MAKCISNAWLNEGTHLAIDITFEQIGTNWPLAKKKRIFWMISCAILPPICWGNEWEGKDQTNYTVETQFYYLINIPLEIHYNVWFKNLHLLQIYMKLKLITLLCLSMLNLPSCILGEIFAKMEATKGIMGKCMNK